MISIRRSPHPPAIGPGTAVLPVLNGLRHLDPLDLAFGPERVLGGVAYIAATLTADGTSGT